MQLLHVGDGGEQLYAARALHVLLRCSVAKAEKRQKSHAVLHEADWAAMRDSLSAAARRAAAAGAPARATLTQLALALAALLLKWDAVPPLRILADGAAALGGGADEAARLATLAWLRVLPEEAVSRDLSLHPLRRGAAADALRSGSPAVLAALNSAVAGAAADDTALQAQALDAFTAWCDFGAPAVAVAAAALTSGAFGVLASGGPEPLLQPSTGAAAAAASALLQQPSTESVAALAPLLAALRPAAVAAAAASPVGAAVATVLSHAACEAAPHAVAGDAAAAALLAQAMGLLMDAVQHAPGPLPEPPLAWLTPWGVVREAAAAHGPGNAAALSAALMPAALRLGSLVGARMALDPGSGGVEDAEALRSDFADALRDAAALVGTAALLPALRCTLERALATPDAGARWSLPEGCATAAAALCRGTTHSHGAADAELDALCNLAAGMLTAPPPHAAHPQCGAAAAMLLGALGAWLASGAPLPSVDAAATALLVGAHCGDVSVARAASVALMRAADAGAAARLGAAGAAAAASALLAAGGPAAPPPSTLRPGQEPVATILLRALARMAQHAASPAEQCSMLLALLPPPVAAARTALQQLAAAFNDAARAAACGMLGSALRDVSIVVDMAARCGGEHLRVVLPRVWPLLAEVAVAPAAAAHAGVAAELASALWATTAADAMTLAVTAYSAGAQPAFLTLLQRCVTARCGGGDAAAAAALAAAGIALAHGAAGVRDAGAPLLRLLTACVIATPAQLPDALPTVAAVCTASLSHAAGDDARAACSFAGTLLTHAGATGDAGWCTPLVHALLCAANGALPPDCVSDVAAALHAGWRAAGDERFRLWLAGALADPALPRPGIALAAKANFGASLVEPANASDLRRFKRLLKAFCGGKKKQGAP